MILGHLEKEKQQFIKVISCEIGNDDKTNTTNNNIDIKHSYNVLKDGYTIFCNEMMRTFRPDHDADIDHENKDSDFSDNKVLAAQIHNYYQETTQAIRDAVNKCCQNVKSVLERSPPLAIDAVNWNYVEMNVFRIHSIVESETLEENVDFHKQMDDVIASIVDYFKTNMDFDTKAHVDIMNQCLLWLGKFGHNVSVLSDTFEQRLISDMEKIKQDLEKLDDNSNISEFAKLIDRLNDVSTDCKSENLILDAKKLQSTMNRVITLLKVKLSAAMGSIIHANVDLGRRKMKDLVLTVDQLTKLKNEYQALYYNDGVTSLIRNKCLPMFVTNDGNQVSMSDLSSEKIFIVCERARMECIISEYDAAVGKKSKTKKLASAITKPMRGGNHTKPEKKKHVLEKYVKILELESKDELLSEISKYKDANNINDDIKLNAVDPDQKSTDDATADFIGSAMDVGRAMFGIATTESIKRMHRKLHEPDIKILGDVIEHKIGILEIEKFLQANCEIAKEEISLFRQEKYLNEKIRELSQYVENHTTQLGSNETTKHYFFKKLDCNEVEALLIFIKSYNRIETIGKDTVSLIDDINVNKISDHLKEYGKFRIDQVTGGLAFFMSVINQVVGGISPNDGVSRLITKYGNDLLGLKELIDIKANAKAYGNVIDCTFGGLEQLTKETSRFEESLAKICHQTNSWFETEQKWNQSKYLPLMRACIWDLSKLDNYFALENKQEKKFEELKIILNAETSTDSTLAILADAANKNDFYAIRDCLNDCAAQAKAEQALGKKTEQYHHAALSVCERLREEFDKYQKLADFEFSPQTWTEYIQYNVYNNIKQHESKDDSKDDSKEETDPNPVAINNSIDAMIAILNKINNCEFWSHYQIGQEESWQITFERYVKLRGTIIASRLKLFKTIKSHVDYTIEQDDNKILKVQGMLEVLDKVYNSYSGRIRIKSDHQLLTSGEITTRSLAPMPIEEIQHRLNGHVTKITTCDIDVNDMTEKEINEYCTLFTIIVKTEKLCQQSRNKEQELFYNQQWKRMKGKTKSTIDMLVNDINNQQREFYKIQSYKVEWLEKWEKKFRDKGIIDSNEMTTIDECLTNFKNRKTKEDDDAVKRLKQRLEDPERFEAAFKYGVGIVMERIDFNDKSMADKVNTLLLRQVANLAAEIGQYLEANTAMKIPIIVESYCNIKNLTNDDDIINTGAGSTLLNALLGIDILIGKKISQFCDTVATNGIKNSIEKEKLKDEIKFMNVLLDEKYNNLVKKTCGIELDTKLSDFFQRLVDTLDGYLSEQTEMNIDKVIDIFEQLNTVIELEKQPNIVKTVTILGTQLYTTTVTKWTNFLTKCKNEIVKNSPIVSIDNFSNQNNSARLQYYRRIEEKMRFLERSLEVGKHIPNLDSAFSHYDGFIEPCKRSVYNQTSELCADIKKYIDNDDHESFAKIDRLYNNVVSIHEVGIVTGDLYQNVKETILKALGDSESRFRKLIDDNTGTRSIIVERAKCLVYLQRAVHHFSNDEIKNSAFTKVDSCLLELAERKPFDFRDLAKVLENMEKPDYVYAREIIGNYGMFNGQVTKWWNDKIKLKSIDSIVEMMQEFDDEKSGSTRDQTKNLCKAYEIHYNKLFNRILRKWDTKMDELTNLVHLKVFSDLEQLVGKIRDKSDNNLKRREFNKEMLNLIAHVFCIWTFLESSYYWTCAVRDTRLNSISSVNSVSSDNWDSSNEEKTDLSNSHRVQVRQQAYLRRPHVVQVIAIIRLLGLHHTNRKGINVDLNKNFIQIGTGEGKSLIVAAIACILGLIGWEVYCASYSKELSNRDRSNYLNLFHRLGVVSRIFYGTFEELSEVLIKQNVDIAQRVRELFNSSNNNYNTIKNARSKSNSTVELSQKASKTILIVDEVDVFFDRKKISKTLSKVAHIKNLYISRICDLIWDNKKNIKSMRDLYNVNGFKKLLQECLNSVGDTWKTRIKREINDMVQDVQIFRNFERTDQKPTPYNYVVKNDKIGHRINDYVDFNTNRRYQTLFAYYYENEANTISNEALEKAKHFHFHKCLQCLIVLLVLQQH